MTPVPVLSNARGVAWALLAVGLFFGVYLSGRLTGGIAAPLQIMALRYAGGFLTVLVWMAWRGEGLGVLRTSQAGTHVLRAGAGAFGGASMVYAATYMPVASASAIGMLDGLFTVLLGMWLLREVVPLRQWLATLLCAVGAVVVVAEQGAFTSLSGALWMPAGMALLAAVLFAVESILIKRLVRTEAWTAVLCYVNGLGCLLLLVPAALVWEPLPAWGWLAFLALGPLAITAQWCNLRAFSLVNASVVGAIRYSWVAYGILFGYVLFGESPTAGMGAGLVLIVAGGAWLARLRRPPA